MIIDKIRQKLFNFMQKRNGADELSRIVFAAALVCYLISAIVSSSLLYVISLCGIVYSFFRMFSKNVQERQKENLRFIRFFQFQKKRFSMRKEYRVFTCKGCGRHIRVPKKKGKVEVTCPVCGRKEIHRT